MKIILMRHGEAKQSQSLDSERQLTPVGQAQAQQTAEHILAKYQPDSFVVSPYIRAQQTLDAFIKKQPDTPVTVVENITPSDDAQKGIHSLMDIEGNCVLVVCHMPIVAKMAALLSGTDVIPYALAEARVFEAEFIATDMGEQIDRFIPDQP